MKKVLLTALALLMGTFMYAQQNRVKIPGVTPSKDVKTEAVLKKTSADVTSSRAVTGDSQLTYSTGSMQSSKGVGGETYRDCDPITTFPYFNDFENFASEVECWVSIDNDGDGEDWLTGTAQSGQFNGYNSSSGLVSKSYNYDEEAGVGTDLDADNYLVSPEFVLPANGTVTLSWYAMATGGSNWPDYYEVMIAPNGSTEISDFVSVYSEDGPTSWAQRTADISAYAGTTVRVVFHHQDYAQYWIIIDNLGVTVEGGSPEPGECTITTFPYFNDFENFLDDHDCWVSIDADGDGYDWLTGTSDGWSANLGVDSTHCLLSQSYINYAGSLNADNYILTPEFELPAGATITLSWMAAAQDPNWPDTYEVLVAPNGSTEISDFVLLFTDTPDNSNAYAFLERSLDLSDYAGTTVRVVFRHHDYDMFYIKIDNLGITVEEIPEPTGLTVTPTNLGARPNGAWMEPVTVEVGGEGYNVTAMEMENDYFTFDGTAVPFTTPASFAVTTGTAATGLVEGTLSFMYNNSKTVKQFTMTATAYDPVEGDVVETAKVVENPAGYTDTPTGVYHNYNLPGDASDGADAVYKLTFASDVMLDANVGAAANGKVALYAEDFNGEGGPMATNNYEYNGPQVVPGPRNIWFSYPYTGSNTFFGSSTSGMIFGYELTADVIAENELAGLTLMEVESAAREAYPYDLIIMTGSTQPENLVYYQPMGTAAVSMSFFTLPLSEPYVLGEENTWILFMTDSPYSAYCGINPADVRGKIWYSQDLATWYSSLTCTPEIYCHFLELPTGREMSMNLADMTVKANFAGGAMSEMTAEVNGMSKAAKNNSRSGSSSIFSCDFEDFLDDHTGWVSIDADGDGYDWLTGTEAGWYSKLGVDSTHCLLSQSYINYAGSLNADNYILTPEFELPAGATITLSWMAAAQDPNWPDTYEVLVAPNGSTEISDFVSLLIDTPENEGAQEFLERSLDLSNYAGTTVRVVFRHHDYDMFYIKIDNLGITAEGGDPEPGAGMFVPAGTYYLVAQATEAFTTRINATAAPAPEQAVIINPTDGMTNVESPVAASWTLGNYTKEMQVLVGSQYPPQDVLIDWTSSLVGSATINDLLPNTTYFMQVNARNDSGVTMGEIIGFTTVLNAPAVLEVATSYLYPGDAAMLSWEMNRSFRGYNVYVDEMKVNEALITESEYAVEGLEYGPHTLNVTAVYDEGESAYSNDIEVEMTGFGHVAGAVYEQDSITPIAGAEVKFIGTDAFGFEQTFTFTSANDGTFTGDVYEGSYIPVVLMDGYQETALNEVNVAYESTVDGLTFIVREFFKAPGSVVAEELENNTVNVYWDWNPATLIEDFEHDGEMPEGWNQVGSYGWEITNNAPYEGTYCIKSSNAGIASSTGAIEMTVDVPYEAKMSFYVKPSCESNYDKFYFYIDGVEKFNTSGAGSWTKKEYTVEAGTHTYKWAYTKDSSVNSNDDCIYVDYVTLYEKTVPTPPVVGGTTYDFEDGFQGWTSLDADGDGFGWMLASQLGITSPGHDGSADFVYSQSYDNTYGVLYPDNYLVSPSKLACQAGAQVKLWACGQDASYAAEHFGVAVSTGGATAAEFNTIAEWTIGSKGGRAFKSADNKAAVRGTRDQSEWTEYTVDLSAYAGQEVWVAIRHFNVSDQYFLDVDDITLATGGAKMETADNRSFQSYNVYRKNVLTDEMMPIYSTTDTTYIDAQWSSLPAGVYQYGVSATYEGNRAQANASGVSRPAVPVTDASIDVTGRRPGQSPAYNGTMSNVFRGSTAYVDNTYGSAIPSGLCVMDIDNPLGATLLNANTSLYAGEIVDGVIYGYDSSGNFVTIDPATGAILSTVSTGATIREMAYDYTTNTMYGSSTSENTLYTIDLATGAYTAVGTMSNVTAVAGLVCDLNGQLYAMAFTTGDLYMVDKTNASMTYVGNTGRTPAYVQSAAIDYETGVCYWAYSDASNDDLYTVNLATAQASFVCSFVESCGLCFPHAGAPVPPAPTGDGESEITWSNTLEKGMVVAVDVTVVCNNGQSAEGATVKFTNMVEDLIIEGTADAAGIVSFPEFRSGYYTMEIAKAGYATVTDEVEIFEDKSYDITLNEMIAPAEGLFVSATGWVMWENIGGDIPTPGEGDEFTEDFESGSIPTGWTTIDADGDGNDWMLASELGLTEPGHNNSADFMLSQSYINYVGALTPDNYLVTPKVKITTGSEFSFWACAQDPSYPSEHYGVAISTTTATAGAFTTIAEWTMTAKETVGAGTYTSRDGKGTSGGTWYQKTVDLSSYAGQEVYIAIRHFNCTDCFYLNVDDAELSINSKGSREALHSIVMLDGVIAGQATGNWFQLDTDNLVEGQEYEVSVASVYASGMSEWRTTTFTYYSCDNFKPGVKNLAGEAEGNNVTLTWTLPGGGGSGDEFSFAFDNDLEGWTNIDADGDGHMWYHSNEAANHSTLAVTSHSGAGHVMGESYCNATWAALTPNDFFVTPQQYNIGASSMLSFWACAQDENYAAEHFGVAISTSGNTSASDFTTIAEWTLTAKEGAKGPRATDGSREGAWYEYTCDLSEYAGQAAWIAIRHFNCSDQFIMCLDDISMSNADGKANRDDEYLQYCTEEYSGAVGTGGGQVWWANAYTPAQLADYNGRSITKVGQWVSAPDMYGNIYDGTYNVEVYVGGSTSAPGTLVASASQYITGDDAWHDIELDTPVTIDATQHLWFVFNATGISYPMCGCDYVGDPNSDILSLDGMVWEHAASGYGLSYTWMIRGLVSGDAPIEGDFLGAMIFRDGELITPEPVKVQQMVDENVAEGEHEYMARLAFGNPEFGVLDTTWYAMSCPVFATVNVENDCTPVNNLAADYEFDAEGNCTVELTWACADASAESFKVYRDGVFIGETADMVYTDDRTNNPGSYTYGVVAVYEYCESEMVTVDITITDVEENDVVEGIYPNPTTGNLYIKAAAMQQVTVANALGQVMMNETVSGDETMIDMSAYEAGVYMVSVTTENGTTVKRISVVK